MEDYVSLSNDYFTGEIFEISKDFPKEEKYSLTDQIRRSSRSVTSNIAESWAKRRYEKAFVNKLTDSLGEEYETESWPYEINLNKLHLLAMRTIPNRKLFLLM
jgi:four helix bundle protein